jgi:hypothetical protein
MNGTMSVNTTAIQTDTRCAVPSQLSATPSNTGDLTVTATSVEGCSLALAVNPNNAAEQYGVVNVPNCGVNTTDPAFQPVRQSITFLWCGAYSSYIGILLVLATKLKQLGWRFLPTSHALLRRDCLCTPQ